MLSMIKTFATNRGYFIIRPYQDADETGVLKFWADVFGQEMPLAIWRWKYIQNPYGKQILLCLDQQNNYAAFYGGIPFPFSRPGMEIRFTQLMDNMSHPAYRGAGIFLRTAKIFFEHYGGSDGSVYMYGFPGKLHFDIGVNKLQYQAIPGKVQFLSGSTRKIQEHKKIPTAAIQPIQPENIQLDRLWQTCRRHYPLAVIRDTRFLTWRFGRHPSKTYRIWGYYPFDKDSLTGYAVLDLKAETAYLVDWLAPRSTVQNVDFLARLASSLRAEEVKHLKTWLPGNHFLAQAAHSAGMQCLPEPLGFIPTVRACSAPFTLEWVGKHLYYTMADGDLF